MGKKVSCIGLETLVLLQSNNMINEKQILEKAQKKGGISTLKAYLRLSGPGWLQSAITLGGGSLGGALFLGVFGGYSLLWVQLLAMTLGVIMLCAISYVTLSTGRSPFEAIRNDINPVLAWGWLLASLMANLVWVLPQYSLAYAAISDNLFPDYFVDAGEGTKYVVSLILLFFVTGVTFFYGRKNIGIRVYEFILKIMVAGIVLCFMAVVIDLSMNADDFNILEILNGFIPNLNDLTNPISTYQKLIDSVPNEIARAFWTQEIVNAQQMRMVAAAAAAVGINMTFLLPFSMLSKGWTREFRGLAIFDLSTAMIIPFVLAVSCVVIVAAYKFHGKPYEGLLKEESGRVMVIEDSPAKKSYDNWISQRTASNISLMKIPISDSEKKLAAVLVPRDLKDFAKTLPSTTLFGFGVLAMTLSTISLLMLISGFIFCEMLGIKHGGLVQKLGVVTGSIGVLWPMLWTGESKAYLVVVTSSFGYILFPIACLAFFLMMNSKRFLGDDMPRGVNRIVWNTLMGISLLITGLAAGYTATTKTINGIPVGTYGFIGFIILILIGQLYIRKKHQLSS